MREEIPTSDPPVQVLHRSFPFPSILQRVKYDPIILHKREGTFLIFTLGCFHNDLHFKFLNVNFT